MDKEFIPYLKSINSLNDFCTTQSCRGHRKHGFFGDHRWGELRLRLSQRAMEILETYLTLFYQHPSIVSIDKRYHAGRKWAFGNSGGIYEEIIIAFSGIDRSRSRFKDSIEFIINTLQMMQRELDLKDGRKYKDLRLVSDEIIRERINGSIRWTLDNKCGTNQPMQQELLDVRQEKDREGFPRDL